MTEIPARLSVVTLGARGMGVLRSLYRPLGWPELPTGDKTWTGFLLGVLLALFPLRDLTAEAAPRSGNTTGWSGVTPRLYCRHPRRGSTGPSPRPAPLTRPRWLTRPTGRGGRSAFIADPEGNRWEITWGLEPPSVRAAPCPPGFERGPAT
jgi:uncharacterized protein